MEPPISSPFSYFSYFSYLHYFSYFSAQLWISYKNVERTPTVLTLKLYEPKILKKPLKNEDINIFQKIFEKRQNVNLVSTFPRSLTILTIQHIWIFWLSAQFLDWARRMAHLAMRGGCISRVCLFGKLFNIICDAKHKHFTSIKSFPELCFKIFIIMEGAGVELFNKYRIHIVYQNATHLWGICSFSSSFRKKMQFSDFLHFSVFNV